MKMFNLIGAFLIGLSFSVSAVTLVELDGGEHHKYVAAGETVIVSCNNDNDGGGDINYCNCRSDGPVYTKNGEEVLYRLERLDPNTGTFGAHIGTFGYVGLEACNLVKKENPICKFPRKGSVN